MRHSAESNFSSDLIEYLREFESICKTVLGHESGDEKNRGSKISWDCPFKVYTECPITNVIFIKRNIRKDTKILLGYLFIKFAKHSYSILNLEKYDRDKSARTLTCEVNQLPVYDHPLILNFIPRPNLKLSFKLILKFKGTVSRNFRPVFYRK
jgi:RNA recognition motif-containing protein